MTDFVQGPCTVSPARVFAFADYNVDGSFHENSEIYHNRAYSYDEDRTWVENMANGLPERGRNLPPCERCWAPQDKWVTFLNHKLASPLGVAAGPLLSSQWVRLAASRGFDCMTYKTIRSHYHPGHGLPNIIHLQVDEQLPVSGPACKGPLYARDRLPGSGVGLHDLKPGASMGIRGDGLGGGSSGMLAITNSFGMPSLGPEQLAEDLPAAAAALNPGQMMVVSITGTPGRPGLSFQEDLVLAARTALAGGATALEVNLSCPNVGASHVALYQDAPAVEALLAGLIEEVGRKVPLVIKMGSFPDCDGMRRVLQAAGRTGVGAVSGINGISRRVELPGGAGPALGPDRPTSGVCGDPIRAAGLEFVTRARQIIAAEDLGLELVGVGGVTQANHVMEYLQAGADIVQTATGFMWRPNLGIDFQRLWASSGYSVQRADGRGGRG
ncbi:hypothetical protein Vafri_20941 [Volvox africanus]|uniref:Dihydroorotate dehydrogenase catalytic domain-containing protein n=1 Tax=Volvox africanus TaxID=51714 RepID=A0A8J4BR12_9CHLO|nr:hypothetical protein Vafri_20941 [Volvox africanus]